MLNLTPIISKILHKTDTFTQNKLHFSLQTGKIYDSNPIFWNDGFVGFIIGVPLTYVIYMPLLKFINPFFHFPLYILCAFLSFVIQHIFRKKWVFKSNTTKLVS